MLMRLGSIENAGTDCKGYLGPGSGAVPLPPPEGATTGARSGRPSWTYRLGRMPRVRSQASRRSGQLDSAGSFFASPTPCGPFS